MQVLLCAIATTSLAECKSLLNPKVATWYMIYRKDEYKILKDTIETHIKKLTK